MIQKSSGRLHNLLLLVVDEYRTLELQSDQKRGQNEYRHGLMQIKTKNHDLGSGQIDQIL
jgi:hypothetical protein